jgi:multiple sugar transport system ATP-binding protein
MADRIAVMHLGVLQQYGTPDEIYNEPVNTFVAGFIGSPAMNLLRGHPVTEGDEVAIVGDDGWRLPLAAGPARRALASSGQVIVGVRHRHMPLSLESVPGWMEGRIYTVEPTGDLTYVHIQLGSHLLVASADADFRAAPDSPIWLTFDQEHLHLFDAETEQLLRAQGAAAPMRLAPDREKVGVA